MSRSTSEYQHLAAIRHHLLVWAGYHRGTSLLEKAMPRFHEIIDEMSTLIKEHEECSPKEHEECEARQQ